MAIPIANGNQSSYRASTIIATKKWKCASMNPPERKTSDVEAAITPAELNAVRARLLNSG